MTREEVVRFFLDNDADAKDILAEVDKRKKAARARKQELELARAALIKAVKTYVTAATGAEVTKEEEEMIISSFINLENKVYLGSDNKKPAPKTKKAADESPKFREMTEQEKERVEKQLKRLYDLCGGVDW